MLQDFRTSNELLSAGAHKEANDEPPIICENFSFVGAVIEVSGDGDETATDEMELYMWRKLRDEQDKEFEEALLADQARVCAVKASTCYYYWLQLNKWLCEY